jgi:hypothetical protein
MAPCPVGNAVIVRIQPKTITQSQSLNGIDISS